MKVLLSTLVLNDGDAIGNDLLGMARTLRKDGHECLLFAEKTRVEADVLPLERLADELQEPDTLLIHHHSIRCDLPVRAIERHPSRAIVKYHNVTPPQYFVEASEEIVEQAAVGQQQAVHLAKLGIPFWVDSQFNGGELARVVPGFQYEVLPPFHQTEFLRNTLPDSDSLDGLDDWTTTLLCVGRVAPNKKYELAIETLSEYRSRFDPTARLLIAGEQLFPTYTEALHQHAVKHGVADAMIVTGRMSNSQLKALYQSADVLLVTSDHEGFCVPLVEAMGLGVPIVAVPRTAIPDTAAEAASYANDAAGLANHIARLIDHGTSRENQLRLGQSRYRDCFAPDVLANSIRELLDQLGTATPRRRAKNPKRGLHPNPVMR
jgi:glycosyltransferase involved in cell wall biosynthesis